MGTRTGTYYTGTMSGTAGSLITVLDAILVAGQNWTKLFSGTNKAVYQTNGGNGFVLRVEDSGTISAGGAREATVRGAESASDIDTLVDPFSFTTYWTNAESCWRKSDTADATARSYWAVADDRFVIIFVRFGTLNGDLYWFGDLERFWTGDSYLTTLLHRGSNNSTGSSLALTSSTTIDYGSAINTTLHIARRADGLLKFVNGTIVAANSEFGSASAGVANYPSTSTTKLHMQPTAVNGIESQDFNGAVSAAAMPRGAVPYLFECLHGDMTGVADGDTFTATAYDASSQFIILSGASVFTALSPRVILQTAGTWNPGF